MNSPATIGVAIPAYNNADSLRACLRSIERIAPALLPRTVVVDDSGDGHIAAAMRTEFPAVQWVVHAQNLGFGRAATDAVGACVADIVVLLNDDIKLLTDPAARLRDAFSDEKLFAVTFRSETADGRLREGAKRLVWPMGFPRILHGERDQRPAQNGRLLSAYAVGGHAAFDRAKFLELGGFDALFDPFYWEDVDLSVRARQQGWSTIYVPECRVRHAEHGAIRSHFDRARIREITLRNRLLFAWRHLPGPLWPLHAISLLCQALADLPSSERLFVRAYRAARERWRQYQST